MNSWSSSVNTLELTKKSPAPARSLAELFEEQVARTPSAVALIEGARQLTYIELNERANRLANYLLRRKAGLEVPIGVLSPRSIDLVVAILAILKSGGVYVPLDLRNPPARIYEVISDTGMNLLITSAALAREKSVWGVVTIDLADVTETIASESPETPAGETTPENLAYLVYTSGSTGKPKAVMIPQRVFMRCERLAREVFGFTARDRFLFRSIRAPEELFFPLLIGGRLYVAEEGVERDSSLLLGAIRRDQISSLVLSPSILSLLIDEKGLGECRSLRTVLCSGELLSGNLANKLLARLQVRLYNCYGLAEAPFTAAFQYAVATRDSAVPIGEAFDASICLLDANRQPVAANQIGEMYIGGPGLARGYLGREEETARRFISLSSANGSSFYKTGDLARYVEGIGYLLTARSDLQMKVRGFRLEPGEVEAAIRTHPAIREVCVGLDQSANGDSQLLAQLILDSEAKVTSSELRNYLRDRLPEHAIPTRYFVFPLFPLTITGKLDRSALASLSGKELPLGTRHVGPRHKVEEQLITIWEEVLQRTDIGIEDNFFDLGGNSLLASRVISRVRSVFEAELPLALIFEQPTIGDFAKKIDGSSRLSLPPLRPLARTFAAPLSFGQEGLWFLHQMEPASLAYHIPEAWLLAGPLDTNVLQRSLDQVISRHEILRTCFRLKDGNPVQIVAPAVPRALQIVDLSSIAVEHQSSELRQQIMDLQKPFDLGELPLLRIKLLRLASDQHLLLLNVHHIIADEWSLGIVYRELSASYEAFCRGQLPKLPELAVQYTDYSIWQRNCLQSAELKQLEYWRTRLEGAPTLHFPTDRPRPAKQTYKGERFSFALSREVGKQLDRFNRAANVTPFMTLLSVFQILLARYSGQEDVLVGTPIAAREHVDLENLVGFFVNTVVLRGDLSNDITFRELVRQTRKVILDAYQHQALPFERVVQEINPARDLSRHPLFQILFTIQNAPEFRPSFRRLEVSPYPLPARSTHFDLEFSFRQAGGQWNASFIYNTDLFEAATIARLSAHFCRLIDGLLAEPARPAHEITMLTEAEEHRLLYQWNATSTSYPRERCIQQLFEAQVERTPAAGAVIDGEENISYRELDRRANQLANHLRSRGVGPEDRVGICLERSVEMVAALLGILKAGAAYVPIDPSYPKERIEFIMADAAISVLLTSARQDIAKLNQHIAIVDLETALPAHFDPPLNSAGPRHLAYIIYTSGSTGRPKGVMIEHRNVTALLDWAHHHYSKAELAGVLASTSICFDLSVFELFVPLTCGGTVILARDILRLPELPARKLVTLINTVPSAMAELVRAKAIPESVVTVNVAGEPLKSQLVREIYQNRSVERVYDLYGPSEDTTYSTCGLRRSDEDRATIGRPIANKQSYILDQRQRPVPIGVTGELYLGGDGVARGYLDRPDLTSERFISNPFHKEANSKLYRTGDLARFLDDGRMEFLGRLDQQIKVRGFRIELGEIEAAVLSHSEIEQCVAIVRQNADNCGQLVCYFVARTSGDSTLSARLQASLRQKLPAYMVPSHFISLERVPLTASGKIDRGRLPEPGPETIHRADGAEMDIPRDEMERRLVAIWSGLLGTSAIGIEDNFFAIGGHSLLAVRLVSEINHSFGTEIRLAPFFLNPTIDGLAAAIRAGGEWKKKPPGLIFSSGSKNLPSLFCAPSIGMVERFPELQHLARLLEDEVKFCGFDPAPAVTDIGNLADHCIRLMRLEQPTGPYSVIGFCQAGHVAYEIGQRLEAQHEKMQLLMVMDCSPRNFAPDLRQRLFWLRERIGDGPRGLLHALRRRMNEKPEPQAVDDEIYAPYVLHHQVALSHRPRRYGGRLVLLNSREYFEVKRSKLVGWDAFAREIEAHVVNCLHQELIAGDGVKTVAEILPRYLRSS